MFSLAEDSYEISSLIFSGKQKKSIYECTSAAVVIGALQIKSMTIIIGHVPIPGGGIIIILL